MSIKQRCSHGIDSKQSYGSYLCHLVSDAKRKELMTEFWSLPGCLAKKTNKEISRHCFLIADSGQRVKVCRSLFLVIFALDRNRFSR